MSGCSGQLRRDDREDKWSQQHSHVPKCNDILTLYLKLNFILLLGFYSRWNWFGAGHLQLCGAFQPSSCLQTRSWWWYTKSNQTRPAWWYTKSHQTKRSGSHHSHHYTHIVWYEWIQFWIILYFSILIDLKKIIIEAQAPLVEDIQGLAFSGILSRLLFEFLISVL